ncbi:MAG: hypothetical protein ACYCX6_01030, partial [Vulcanimicrobiaceae bacterium]
YSSQGLVTAPVLQLGGRVDLEYKAAVAKYNRYVRSLTAVDAALKQAGFKELGGVSTVTAGI